MDSGYYSSQPDTRLKILCKDKYYFYNFNWSNIMLNNIFTVFAAPYIFLHPYASEPTGYLMIINPSILYI